MNSNDELRGAVHGIAAGVPFVALPPANPGPASRLVIAWHLLDSPRTEAAFAAALPLYGLDAWRIYLGLPMSGSRLPAGGVDEVRRMAFEDAVTNLHGPIASQAAAEFEPALTELRARFSIAPGPIGLVGGSLGAAVASLALTESNADIAAAVLVSPLVQLRPFVEAMSRAFDMTYAWSVESDAIAARLDFVARSKEIAAKGDPAVLLVVGEDDVAPAFLEPATSLRDSLVALYSDQDRVDLVTISGMGHALAEEPGIEPAAQTPHAARVDELATDWLARYLPAR